MFYPEPQFNLPATADEPKDKSEGDDESAEEDTEEPGAVFLEDDTNEPYSQWDDDSPHSEKMSKGLQGKKNQMKGGAGKGPKHFPSGFDLFKKK